VDHGPADGGFVVFGESFVVVRTAAALLIQAMIPALGAA
jgi:hypothetical protein